MSIMWNNILILQFIIGTHRLTHHVDHCSVQKLIAITYSTSYKKLNIQLLIAWILYDMFAWNLLQQEPAASKKKKIAAVACLLLLDRRLFSTERRGHHCYYLLSCTYATQYQYDNKYTGYFKCLSIILENVHVFKRSVQLFKEKFMQLIKMFPF